LVGGAPFIVMELLCGVTLAERLKQGPVRVRDALVFARAMLSALAAAHALGIVHRDIKPHNLFLHECEEGKTCLKVLDFGVARVLPDAPPAAPIPLNLPTQTGMLLGTPRFVSPEAAAGCPVDTRGDLYAVGLVLYTLVAGRGPFDHVRTMSEVLNAHTSMAPEPPSRYAREALPEGFDSLVLKALSKRPKHRYQSAEEFDAAVVEVQRALAFVARSRPSSPPRPSPSRSSTKNRSLASLPLPSSSPLPSRSPSAVSLQSPVSPLPSLSGTSVKADRDAGRPARLSLRPAARVAIFLGTLLITSVVGAGGATLLGRMVGGLP